MLISAFMAIPAPERRSGQAASPSQSSFQPYVSAAQSPAEFTVKAVLIGAFFGIIFGASTVYLGLRAGLTVSASIPALPTATGKLVPAG